MEDGAIWVWRDDVHRSKFWVCVWKGGRVDWLKGGFKSSAKALKEAKEYIGQDH